MIFIRKFIPAKSYEWGICSSCKEQPSYYTLCQSCLGRRDAHHKAQLHEIQNSWEFKLRAWLANLLDPTKSKRY